MSYARITTGLHDLIAAIDGVELAIEYEPTSIQLAPCVYSILEDFTSDGEAGVIITTYRTLHRLCVPWGTDPEQSETTLRELVDAIPAAFRANRTLSGYARYVEIASGDAGWTTVGGTEYRTVDFYSEALDVGGQP